MQYKIINTGDYLLIVDDSEIKKETYCYDSINNILVFYKGSMKNIGFQKVISHLPLNNSSILEGVDLLPSFEDEVEKLANDHANHWIDGRDIYYGFKIGYNKAKEKYNKNLIDWIDNISNSIFAFQASEIELKMLEQFKSKVQSLQQPKMPIGFESQMVCRNLGCIKMALNGENSVCCGDNMEPKTTTNSQGLTQWIGEYIYD